MTPWPVARQVPLYHGILQARILEWVVISFSRGSPQPRDPTRVSRIADRFLTVWATRETLGDGPQGISEIIYLGKNLLGKVVLVILRIALWGAKAWMTVCWYFSLEETVDNQDRVSLPKEVIKQ